MNFTHFMFSTIVTINRKSIIDKQIICVYSISTIYLYLSLSFFTKQKLFLKAHRSSNKLVDVLEGKKTKKKYKKKKRNRASKRERKKERKIKNVYIKTRLPSTHKNSCPCLEAFYDFIRGTHPPIFYF